MSGVTALGLGGLLLLTACPDSKPGGDAEVAPAASPATPELRLAVVMVAPDDALNVRAEPSASAPIVAKLRFDQREVRATSRSEQRGNAEWLQIQLPDRTGWVNAAFVTPQIAPQTFADDPRPRAMLRSLAEVLASRGDLAPLIAPRGLWIHHYGPPRHFPRAATSSLAAAERELRWHGAACGEACIAGSFHQVIAKPLLRVLQAPITRTSTGAPPRGGNASAEPPRAWSNFPVLGLYHPGTDEMDHLDWAAVGVFFEYVRGEPRIVGLHFDSWSP